ncbi:hypothetical protein Q5425_19980 [Amycolatopsis sp. A133]|uniref:hypothetical protein n=1 Tax=Amycolatopsis sp. A133 TaxID=3064472 RepID=UPI0027EACFD0|nr:hypothetical protein [Amycolatopsis sp. A133]MDQ7806026.1 hypothetical protein [Amycolatopsis sp. A133]
MPRIRWTPNTHRGRDVSPQVAALGAFYQAERAENVTLLNINIALLGAALAYAAASVAFLDKIASLPRTAAALVPSPLWLAMLYSTLLVALAGKRGTSAMLVENELFRHTGIDANLRKRVGSRAGEYVVNPKAAPWPYRLIFLLVYTVPWIVSGFYTWHLLDHFVKSGKLLFASATGYTLMLLVAGAAYLRDFRNTPIP